MDDDRNRPMLTLPSPLLSSPAPLEHRQMGLGTRQGMFSGEVTGQCSHRNLQVLCVSQACYALHALKGLYMAAAPIMVALGWELPCAMVKS